MEYLCSEPILWISSQVYCEFMVRRIEELRFLQVRFFKQPRLNYGIMTSIIVHLLRNVSFVVPAKHPHLVEALRDMSYEGVIQRFGMFFLQDLNPNTGELLVISQEDSPDVVIRLTFRVQKGQKSRNPNRSHVVQQTTKATPEYPLGEHPTWNQLIHCLQTDPASIMHSQRWIANRTWGEYASELFIAFTNDIWLTLDPLRLRNNLGSVTTIDDAMQSWSISHLVNNLISVRFLPNSHGLDKNTKQSWDFSTLLDVFFPDVHSLPQNAVWTHFSKRHGYLHKYQEYQDSLPVEQFLDIKQDLETLLGHTQCLPNSAKATDSRPGKLWTGFHGTVDMRTNSRCYKLKGIGSAKQIRRKVMRINLPSHQVATRLDQAQGISTRASKKSQAQDRRTARSKNKRIPPHGRDGAHDVV